MQSDLYFNMSCLPAYHLHTMMICKTVLIWPWCGVIVTCQVILIHLIPLPVKNLYQNYIFLQIIGKHWTLSKVISGYIWAIYCSQDAIFTFLYLLGGFTLRLILLHENIHILFFPISSEYIIISEYNRIYQTRS